MRRFRQIRHTACTEHSPLISIRYHDIKLNLKHKNEMYESRSRHHKMVYVTTPPPPPKKKLLLRATCQKNQLSHLTSVDGPFALFYDTYLNFPHLTIFTWYRVYDPSDWPFVPRYLRVFQEDNVSSTYIWFVRLPLSSLL